MKSGEYVTCYRKNGCLNVTVGKKYKIINTILMGNAVTIVDDSGEQTYYHRHIFEKKDPLK